MAHMSTAPDPHLLTREAAEALRRTWIAVAIAGAISIVCGVIILSIDWSLDDLAIFAGAVFIFEGLVLALSPPYDGRSRTPGAIAGIAGIIAGIAIMVWPEPSLLVLAIFIGAWILASGIINIVGWIIVGLVIIERWTRCGNQQRRRDELQHVAGLRAALW